MDCFAPLAMTVKGLGIALTEQLFRILLRFLRNVSAGSAV
jgi:hypothetical protein